MKFELEKSGGCAAAFTEAVLIWRDEVGVSMIDAIEYDFLEDFSEKWEDCDGSNAFVERSIYVVRFFGEGEK